MKPLLVASESASLVETLLWLCGIPSPTGEEGPICDALVERLSRVPLAAPIRRYGHSIVAPLSRSEGSRRPKIALVPRLLAPLGMTVPRTTGRCASRAIACTAPAHRT